MAKGETQKRSGSAPTAVTMQLERRLALTPALSPREREKQSRCLGRSPRGDRLNTETTVSLSWGRGLGCTVAELRRSQGNGLLSPTLSSKGGEGEDHEKTWAKCLNSTTVGLG